MAKLSEEVLEQGRECIRQKDLEGLRTWVRTHASVGLSEDTFMNTFQMIFSAGDTLKGLKVFNVTLRNYDPVVERVGSWVRAGLVIFVLLGLLGGVVYLVRTIF